LPDCIKCICFHSLLRRFQRLPLEVTNLGESAQAEYANFISATLLGRYSYFFVFVFCFFLFFFFSLRDWPFSSLRSLLPYFLLSTEALGKIQKSLKSIRQTDVIGQYEVVCQEVLDSLEACVNNLVKSEEDLAKLKQEVSTLRKQVEGPGILLSSFTPWLLLFTSFFLSFFFSFFLFFFFLPFPAPMDDSEDTQVADGASSSSQSHPILIDLSD